MKSYELQPSIENLCETYKNDTIGRNKDLKEFIKLLDSISDCCSIAIDGEWGSGKTFFVNQAKLFINSNNNYSMGISKNVKDVFSTDENHELQLALYYDAWENDNDSDPILSLIYTIVKEVDETFVLEKDDSLLDNAKELIKILISKIAGINDEKLEKIFLSEDILSGIRLEKKIEESVKKFLDSLLNERGNRLVIFIDELDRCTPSYAVKFLERIKHYLTNDRITFVFSVNITELQHTIKRYYGESFDACRYLDRFFDFRITLPAVDKDRFFNTIDFNSEYTIDEIYKKAINYFNFSMRETCKVIRISKMAAYDYTHDRNNLSMGKLFCLMYILPIMVTLKHFDTNKYIEFIKGNYPKPFIEILSPLDSLNFYDLFDSNETMLENEDSSKTFVKIESKLEDIYNSVFNFDNNKNNTYGRKIGSYTFTSDCKNLLLKEVNLLSNNTKVTTI